MKKYYVLVFLIAFNCHSQNSCEAPADSTLNLHYDKNEEDVLENKNIDNEPDYFDELDELATMDVRYIDEPPQQPFYSHFPPCVKRVGIFLLLHYVSCAAMVSKKFQAIKKKLLHTAMKVYAHRKA